MRWSPARPNLARVQPKNQSKLIPRSPLLCSPSTFLPSRRRCSQQTSLPQDRVYCICPFAPFFVSYSAVVGLIFLNKKEKKKKKKGFLFFICKGNPDSQSIYATYYCCDIESVSIPTEGSGGWLYDRVYRPLPPPLFSISNFPRPEAPEPPDGKSSNSSANSIRYISMVSKILSSYTFPNLWALTSVSFQLRASIDL